MFPAPFLQFILVAIVVIKVTTAQQTNQVQARVYEKVDNFVSLPVTDLQTFADYFEIGGFPHNLRAEDRDIATKYLYSLVTGLESAGIMPYFGMEDGTFLGYFHSPNGLIPSLGYREPGDSGYFEDDQEMGIYMNACVNYGTGETEQPCFMEEGELYISCVDNCTLIPCPDSDSQQDCSILPIQQQQECVSNMKWCRNYNIEEYELASSNQRKRGYVPSTEYCINAQGMPAQTPGEVLVVTPAGTVGYGNCMFGSGALVERSLSGPFAYCSTHPSGVCNTTFLGGYDGYNYDTRWRSWYMQTREAQRPIFSDIYVYFDLGVPGITYTHPIYERDDQGRNIFSAVLAFDIILGDISDFLVNSFNETEYFVAIYEDKEPHLMLGVSTGSSVVSMVLEDDNSQVCSEEQVENGLCTVAHATIHTFGSSGEDLLLRKAHAALEESPDEDVSIRESDDDVDSAAYSATSVMYDLPEKNLKWRIVVLAKLGEDKDHAITKDEPAFILVSVIGSVGFVLCFILFILFYQRRNEQAVQFADVSFTSAFILGCALLNLSTLAQLGENTDELCLLRMWMFYLLSSVCLSPLFIKAFRTWKLLGSSASSAMNVKMTNFQAFLRSLPIPIAQTIILVIFTYIDPPLATATIDWESRPVVKGVSCEYETDAFYITQGLFDLILIITGCILAYLTRKIDPRFGDAKALLFAMYNIAFTCAMLVIIFATVNISSSSSRLLQAIGVFWATVFSSAAFIVPRLLAAKKERRRAKKERKDALISINARKSSPTITMGSSNPHDSDESLKILVCSANLGNAEPTLSSMKAWVPAEGYCASVKPLDGESLKAGKFHIIAIGMQEATWGSKKKKDGENMNAAEVGDTLGDSQDGEEDGFGSISERSEKVGNSERSEKVGSCYPEEVGDGESSEKDGVDESSEKVGVDESSEKDGVDESSEKVGNDESSEKIGDVEICNSQRSYKVGNGEIGNSQRSEEVMFSDRSEVDTRDSKVIKEDAFMASVQGEDTVALRKMVRSLLGDDYKPMAQEIRGQMRLHIWALKDIAPYVETIKVSGANTGIGNVLANKGGIVVSMKCMDTRFTFLSAHLAAHEGENYYRNRCNNVYDILRSSKTFDLSQKNNIDLAISSHHMFVLGDLNFRTKFEGDNEHSENFKRAMEMVKAEDWNSLYSYDELHKGIKEGDLLVNFDTLPCNFNPTFKVNRTHGFDYRDQRTPSYTDRILFRSSQNLHENLKPLAYEPCVDFITSDHKPVRGAFSIIPNDIIEPMPLHGKLRLAFSDLECSDLLAGDVEGSSDPYVKFIWDSVAMAEENVVKFSWMGKQKWPRTSHKSKNLNPKWMERIVLVTTGETVNSEAMLYVTVYDYDFMSEDDILGTLPLSLHKLISLAGQESSKEIYFDEPLERFGKFGGRIKFKLDVSLLIG